jgi:hypothetical protein
VFSRKIMCWGWSIMVGSKVMKLKKTRFRGLQRKCKKVLPHKRQNINHVLSFYHDNRGRDDITWSKSNEGSIFSLHT